MLQEARDSGLLAGHVKSRIILESVTKEEGRIDIMWTTSLLCHNLEWPHPGQWTMWRPENGWTCSEEGALQGSRASRTTRYKEELHHGDINAHGSCVLDPAGGRLFSKCDELERKHETCMPCSREHHAAVYWWALCSKDGTAGRPPPAPCHFPPLYLLCIPPDVPDLGILWVALGDYLRREQGPSFQETLGKERRCGPGLPILNNYNPKKLTFCWSRIEKRSSYAEARQETKSKYIAQACSSPWELKLGWFSLRMVSPGPGFLVSPPGVIWYKFKFSVNLMLTEFKEK